MRPINFDLKLYDAGTHTLINSVVAPLVALTDKDALDALTGYLRVYLAQASSLNLVTGAEAIQHFILHAQRAGVLNVGFQDASFDAAIMNAAPQSPPVAPASLWLTAEGGGVVNASCALGSYADRYELQQLVGGAWVTVTQGALVEGGVNFQVTGVQTGAQLFRVIPKWGFFAGFPGNAAEVTVA